jgi:tetratricopeptide (TPR) repeat protein
LTEVLISDLARIHSLRVPSIPRAAVIGTSQSEAETAKRLGVQLLLAGSVTQADSRVRVAVRLVDDGGRVIWGEELTRRPSALLSSQAEIARMVSEHLALTLSPAERTSLLRRESPLTLEAADAYLKGLSLRSFAPARQEEAISLFRRVVELEPTFAPAWAEMAYAEIWAYSVDENAGDRARRAAEIRQLADRAIDLDPSLGKGYLVRGTIQFYQDWDFAAAEVTLRAGLEVDPADRAVGQRLSMLLAAEGRLEEAIELGQRNQKFEPTEAIRSSSLGMLYYYARDFDAAAREMQRAIAIDSKFAAAKYMLGRVYAAQGRLAAASTAIEEALASNREPEWLAEYARIQTLAGHHSVASQVLAELNDMARDGHAAYADQYGYLALAEGDEARALDLLDAAVRDRVVNTLWLNVDPRVDALRTNPRFPQLVSRLGLPQRTSSPLPQEN